MPNNKPADSTHGVANYSALIHQIYDHVEHDRVDNAVLACVRLARLLKDFVQAAVFLRESGADTKGVIDTLYDEVSHLKKDAIAFISERSLECWLAGRTLDYSLGKDEHGEESRILALAAGELDASIADLSGRIVDLSVTPGMEPFDTAYFTDSYQRQRTHIRSVIRAAQTIKQRVRVQCQNYAISVERQLASQRSSQSFLESTLGEVNNFFRSRSDNVYVKLQKAASLVDSTNAEDHALLLTAVRRAVKAVADYFYPPRPGMTLCADGRQRDLSDDQYLNRLTEYLATAFSKSSATGLIKAELDYLCVFFRRLNDLASKGVHAEVTAGEAKQGLLGLYMFLCNVIARLEHDAND